MSAWSEIHGSFEIKTNFDSVLDCNLWSCGLASSMSCSQIGLIWVSTHVQKYTTSWIMRQVRHVFIFSVLWVLHVENNNSWKNEFVDYTWVILNYKFSYSVIVLVQKWKRQKLEKGSHGRYVKLRHCLVSQFKRQIILLTMNFSFPILLFCSKENPILVSDRYVLMGVFTFLKLK